MATRAFELRRILEADSTDAAWAEKAATATKPTGAGVFELPAVGVNVADLLLVKPYGLGEAGGTLDVRAWGWSHNPDHGLWEPLLLLEVACTLGSVAAGKGEGSLEVGAIAYSDGDASARVVSNSAGHGGYFVLDHIGCPIIEFAFKAGTATAANGLFRVVS